MDRRERQRWRVEGRVKGKAFHELTLVAGPNVSDGSLSSSTFCPLGASSFSFATGSSWIQHVVLWAPENGQKRSVLYYGPCSRFLESLISVLLVLFPCRSSSPWKSLSTRGPRLCPSLEDLDPIPDWHMAWRFHPPFRPEIVVHFDRPVFRSPWFNFGGREFGIIELSQFRWVTFIVRWHLREKIMTSRKHETWRWTKWKFLFGKLIH